MGNGNFKSIDEINDREAIGHYNEMIEKGKKPEKAFIRAKRGTRDNARTPFHWSDSKNAGFTTGTPWLRVSSDYRRYNADDEMKNSDSVFSFYKKAIALRKSTKALVYGSFNRVKGTESPVFCYFRKYGDELYYIELNLGTKPQEKPIYTEDLELLLATKGNSTDVLRPFEGNIYKIK